MQEGEISSKNYVCENLNKNKQNRPALKCLGAHVSQVSGMCVSVLRYNSCVNQLFFYEVGDVKQSVHDILPLRVSMCVHVCVCAGTFEMACCLLFLSLGCTEKWIFSHFSFTTFATSIEKQVHTHMK